MAREQEGPGTEGEENETRGTKIRAGESDRGTVGIEEGWKTDPRSHLNGCNRAKPPPIPTSNKKEVVVEVEVAERRNTNRRMRTKQTIGKGIQVTRRKQTSTTHKPEGANATRKMRA